MNKLQRILLALAALPALAGPALAQPNDSPNLVPGNEAYYFEHPWERPQDSRYWQWPQRRDAWRQARLPEPAPGYQWQRRGNEFVLINPRGRVVETRRAS